MRFQVIAGPGVGVLGRALAARILRALGEVGAEASLAPADVVAHPAEDGVIRVLIAPARWLPQDADPRGLSRSVLVTTEPAGTPAFEADLVRAVACGGVGLLDHRVVDDVRSRLNRPLEILPLAADPDPAPAPAAGGLRGLVASRRRPATPADDVATRPRPVDVSSFGPTGPDRLRWLATSAPALDPLRVEHRFVDDGEDPTEDGLLGLLGRSRTHLHAEVPGSDGAVTGAGASAIDPVRLALVCVLAGEAGAVPVVDADPVLLPDGARALVVRRPVGELAAGAAALAADAPGTAALAGRLRTALGTSRALRILGHHLEELGRQAAGQPCPQPDARPLPPPADPPAWPTLAEHLDAARREPDAALRDGVQRTLLELQGVGRRLDRLERPDADGPVRVDRRGADAGLRDGPERRISVVVPCHGAVDTVGETLASITTVATALAGRAEVEAVVVLDGPDAATRAIVEVWGDAQDGVALVLVEHPRNRGLGAARNSGIEHATGGLLLPLDADNVLWPRGVSRLLDALEAEPGARLAYGVLQEFDAAGPRGLRGLHPWERERFRHGNYVDALALVRTDALREAGGYDTTMAVPGFEDWDLWCRFVERGWTAAWVPQPVAGYRVRTGAMSEGFRLSYVRPFGEMLDRHPELLS